MTQQDPAQPLTQAVSAWGRIPVVYDSFSVYFSAVLVAVADPPLEGPVPMEWEPDPVTQDMEMEWEESSAADDDAMDEG